MNAIITIPTWLEVQSEDTTKKTPSWLSDFRQTQMDAFLKYGLPTRKDERFKYTDFSFLANKPFKPAIRVQDDELQDVINQHRLQRGDAILLVLVNGYYMPSLSDTAKLPSSVIVCDLSEALEKEADLIKTYLPETVNAQQYPFASLNAAMSREGIFFYVPDQCQIGTPIHLLSLVIDKNEFIAHPRHIMVLGEQSKLTLIEEHFALAEQVYMMNTVTTFVVRKEATLEHYKIQSEGKSAIHMAHHFVHQMQDSSTNFTHFSFGSQFARDELVVKLEEQGANCKAAGFYHLQFDNQYVDYHVDINHLAPHSHSEMLYKGIIDKKSRAVFNGRLYVEKGAQKILAYQANHNILLSKEAEVYSKPELEIYADDVKCKHGASTGQIDQDAVFYLRSRGISEEEAIAMLLQGFAEDILQRVTNQGVTMRVKEIMYAT